MTDFVVGWLQNLLEGLREQVDEETRVRVLAGCSHPCTAMWADQARAIRQQSPEADITALLTAFCAVLPGGGPQVQVEDDKIHHAMRSMKPRRLEHPDSLYPWQHPPR